MGDGVKLQIVLLRSQIVEHDHGAAALGEEVLQGQHLPAVAQGALRQEPELGEAVDHHAAGVGSRDLLEDQPGGFVEFDLRGMEEGQFLPRIQGGLGGHQLEDVEAVEGPAVPPRDQSQLAGRLRQGDVEHALAVAHAFEEELQGDGGLPGARTALVEIEAVGIQSAAQDVVEAGAAGGDARGIKLGVRRFQIGHRNSLCAIVAETGHRNRSAAKPSLTLTLTLRRVNLSCSRSRRVMAHEDHHRHEGEDHQQADHDPEQDREVRLAIGRRPLVLGRIFANRRTHSVLTPGGRPPPRSQANGLPTHHRGTTAGAKGRSSPQSGPSRRVGLSAS